MKKLLAVLALVLLAAGAPGLAQTPVFGTQGDEASAAVPGGYLDLVALKAKVAGAWELDETTGIRVDVLASNNLTDVNSTGFATGVDGNAADFESTSSQYLEQATPTASLSRKPGFAFSFWVKLEQTDQFRYMAGKRDGSTGDEWHVAFVPVGWGSNPDGYPSYVVCAFWEDGGAQITGARGSYFADLEWNHVVCRLREDGRTEAIVNGNLNSTGPEPGAPNVCPPADCSTSGSAEFLIGGIAFGPQVFDGLIDAFYVFDEDLTDSEVIWLSKNFYGDLP